MDEQQMRAECARIAAEWQAGGLAGGTMYEDFAVELAKRVQAAERERCAAECRKMAEGLREASPLDGSRAAVAQELERRILGA